MVDRAGEKRGEPWQKHTRDVEGRTVRLALPLIILVGAVLRLWGLGDQSLWVDEILTIKAANVDGAMTMADLFSNIQGPLHTLIVRFVSRYSMSEAALRSISAVSGIATIPVVYVLGRDLVNRRTGLVAAGLLAVSPFAIWYSQEVRNYSLLILLATASTLAVWRFIVRRADAQRLYVVAMTLALYSNLSAAFLWLAHTAFGARRLWRTGRLQTWAGVSLAIALLALPLLLGLVRWVEADAVGERVTVASLADEEELLRGATTVSPMAVPYSIYSMVYGYSVGPDARELHTGSPLRAFVRHLWLVLPAGLVAAAGLLAGFRELWRRRTSAWLVAAVVVVPFIAALALAFLNVKPFNVRYVAVMLPLVLVTLAASWGALPKRAGAWICGAVVLFSLVGVVRYRFDPSYAREDVRGAACYIAEHERPGDVVLVPVVRDVFTHYFEGRADHFVLHRGQTASEGGVRAAVAEGAAGHGRLWFVDSRLWHMDPELRTPELLETDFEAVERREFAGVTVTLYDL